MLLFLFIFNMVNGQFLVRKVHEEGHFSLCYWVVVLILDLPGHFVHQSEQD